ncbi:GAG-pre-integrase domain containing protein [Pyrenophora tritici-repentis]|uniref:GAG-pre-integrase domain containing protein n=2 Tax=Pyrenophora tritici-repentis TaxID=45151 RepID=A0A922SWK7_9PLEO|nr:GAG-pre-integrase domain containing protein [Pyrenophora tritici-repentis]
MDSGTTIHVGNDLGRFTNIRPPMTGDFLWAGNTRVWIKAYGSVTLRVDSADGHRLLYLENVAYCPDLHCSLVSFRILRRQGLWWDTKSDPTILRRSDDSELAVLHEKYGQWILELNDAEARAAFSTQQPTRRTAVRKRAEAIVWHKRLGHPGSDALEHLVNQSEGVKIVGVPTVKCDACGISKSKRMIRRTPRTILEGPGERVAIDFHDYEAESTTKEKSQMLINCRVTGYIWDFYLSDNRTARVILKSLKMLVTFMMNQFGITVKVIETDNEIFSVKPEVARWCRTRGIVLEPSAPDTQAQNGGAERSGGVVKEKGRAMRLDAHLPWDQWPEIARTAVYLHNRTPKYQNRWRSPYEMFFTAIAFQNGVVTSPRKPNLSHLRAYGCKAFAMTDDTKRGKGRLQRFDPKAWIGYLVGYRSTNIFRIWVPSIGKVISTRDVVFDEEVVYSGEHKEVMDNLMHSTTEEIAAWIRTIELPPGPNPTREELGTFYEDETIARAPENGRLEYDEAGRKVVPYPTPPHTPPPAALLAQMLTNVEHPFRDDDTGGYGLQSEETAYGKQGLDTSYGEHGVQTGAQREHGLSAGVPREQCDAGGYGLQSEETAYGKQGLDTSYGKQGLASGILHPEHRMLKEPWAAAFMAGTKAGNVQNLAGERLDKAKLERMMRNGKKPHRSQLPPPPQANGLREDHEFNQVLNSTTPTSSTLKPQDVEAVLRYHKPNEDGSPPAPTYDDRPETYYRPTEPHTITVHDVRGQEDQFTLDVNGFQFHKHTSQEKDFVDEEMIKSRYYPETEQLLKDVTGASRVHVFNHAIRRQRLSDDPDARTLSGPVNRIHIDQSYEAALSRVPFHLPEDADKLLKSRVQIINVWRPIKTVRRDPLAVAEANSVNDDSLVVAEIIYPDRNGETYAVKYDPKHKWFYKSELSPDEVLLFKCFDSKLDGRARRVPHTAFAVPGTEDKESRESIEIRALVFHEDQTFA